MKKKELSGQVFGRLKVISFSGIKNTRARWWCKCSCGNVLDCDGAHLRAGDIRSCGCLNKERASQWLKDYATSDKHKGKNNPAFKHGESNTPLYKRYHSMYTRCYTPSNASYMRYGGAGIKLEWKTYLDFKKDMEKSFLAHVKKFGLRNTTIDRINNTKNYNKENCKWATWHEQAIGRRPRGSLK